MVLSKCCTVLNIVFSVPFVVRSHDCSSATGHSSTTYSNAIIINIALYRCVFVECFINIYLLLCSCEVTDPVNRTSWLGFISLVINRQSEMISENKDERTWVYTPRARFLWIQIVSAIESLLNAAGTNNQFQIWILCLWCQALAFGLFEGSSSLLLFFNCMISVWINGFLPIMRTSSRVLG